MKAYYIPGALPENIKLLPPQCLCHVSGGDFITNGTSAALRLPNKPHLTMELDHSSHLPSCLATRSTTVLSQGHQANLCVTIKTNQDLTTSQKILLSWHFCFGHLNFSTMQWILCSGIFGKNSTFLLLGILNTLNVLRVSMVKPTDVPQNPPYGNLCLRGRMR